MHTGLFVKGSWVETDHRLDVLNKYNQESVGSVFVADDEATIEAALCSAQSGAKAIAKLPLYQRADILRKVSVAIGERQEQLAHSSH